MCELCIEENSLHNKKQITNQIKSFTTTLQHIVDSYDVYTMFQTFLQSTLVLENMFLSSLIIP